MTTLKEQSSAERGRLGGTAGDAAAKIVSNSDPVELFGEVSQKWAQLAFANTSIKS